MQLWIHVNKVHGDLRNVRMRRIFLLLFFKYSGYVLVEFLKSIWVTLQWFKLPLAFETLEI
ncbi:hypothetical protein HanXRQr2_Chr11g0488631 [Helianthus annuus]|uniref:Uncharacterized protein n=1 Tax=Helianthus annuus TaxID=4232 RepID=A0A251TCS3_HELAN|nr:hypothetical protein HanXRQr2_Chr11g0488631 [Helianthus annuus]KAJ0874987.1 hypothetical protein HanPSC8_Chr11g0470861 [Helianthus annuus]